MSTAIGTERRRLGVRLLTPEEAMSTYLFNRHTISHRFCPVCRSLQRHRFVWIFFKRTFQTLGQESIRLLHIAPEAALVGKFQKINKLDYLSADLYDRTAMVQMDICNIQYPPAAFDLIYCSHVLEHVADDRQALREFWRVLRPGGWAVLLVPIAGEVTIEDPEITDPVERERIFGQHDHVRRYGMDFIERVEAAGFRVTPVQAKDLAEQREIVMYGLPDLEIIFLCEK